ncbi:MAG TPA: DUF3078 domain-containing protein [Puia sp.]|nr:DUF3078 domain-containing protein [Puia sp.]
MKKICMLACMLFIILILNAQDKDLQNIKKEASQEIKKDPNDTIPKIWKTGGLFTLTFNQAALSNWAAGGDKSSLALNSTLYGYAFYKKGRNSWDNTINLAFGGVKTTSLGTRKTDDRIDILSKYGYEVAKNWYVSALFNFRSQFAKGYNYPNDTSKILTSDLFSPAYVLLSPGINYKPDDHFSVFVSPASARWVIVKNDSLSKIGAFGVDSGKNVKFEFGAYATINYTHKVGANSVYTGRLDLFSNYLRDPQDIDINMTNLLAVKVTGVLAVTFSLNLIYDNDIKSVKSDGTPGGPTLQFQEILGIGLAVKL